MSEATHKAALVKVLRAGLPQGVGRVYRHEDQFTGGIPDISISFKGRTLWVEVKLDRPGRKSKTTELQWKALRELGGHLLVFTEHRSGSLQATIYDALGGSVWSETCLTKSMLYKLVAQRLLFEVGR